MVLHRHNDTSIHYLFLLLTLSAMTFLLASCGGSKHIVAGKDSTYKDEGYVQDSKKPSTSKHSEPANNDVINALISEARTWIGTPYVYGGKEKNGADCSGFVMQVFKTAIDVNLPRVSRDQFSYCEIIEKEELSPGDLVFFSSPNTSNITHVGLYIGNGQMIHASSSRGVIETPLSNAYFVKHYFGSGRVPDISHLQPSKKLTEAHKPTQEQNKESQSNNQKETPKKSSESVNVNPESDNTKQEPHSKRPQNPTPEEIVKKAFNVK